MPNFRYVKFDFQFLNLNTIRANYPYLSGATYKQTFNML